MKYLAAFLEWSCFRWCGFVATENVTKSYQFRSQNVPLLLIKKNKYPYFMLLEFNHASFSPLLHNVFFHKTTVRESSSRMSISTYVF